MSCPTCYGYGCGYCVGYGAAVASSPKPPPTVKVGELYAGRCKRCRGEALRVSEVLLDKLQLFCKLCGQPQEVKR